MLADKLDLSEVCGGRGCLGGVGTGVHTWMCAFCLLSVRIVLSRSSCMCRMQGGVIDAGCAARHIAAFGEPQERFDRQLQLDVPVVS